MFWSKEKQIHLLLPVGCNIYTLSIVKFLNFEAVAKARVLKFLNLLGYIYKYQHLLLLLLKIDCSQQINANNITSVSSR